MPTETIRWGAPRNAAAKGRGPSGEWVITQGSRGYHLFRPGSRKPLKRVFRTFQDAREHAESLKS